MKTNKLLVLLVSIAAVEQMKEVIKAMMITVMKVNLLLRVMMTTLMAS